MIPMFTVLAGAAPDAPVEGGALAVVAEPAVELVLLAVFDDELQAAAPATTSAALMALSAFFAQNRLMNWSPLSFDGQKVAGTN
jgi:hypothetical protein